MSLSVEKTKLMACSGKDHIWSKICINDKTVLQNVYQSPDIIMEIKVRRLEWLGHIIRKDEARMAKKVFVSKPEGRRDIGI
jgi:hypothetical protein